MDTMMAPMKRQREEPPSGPASIIFVVLVLVVQVAGVIWIIRETLKLS